MKKAEERIRTFEGRTIEVITSEEQKEKNKSDLWYIIK